MIRSFETLARIPLFGDLPLADVQRLDSQCIWRRATTGEYILDYNDGGADLYFVVAGKVRVKDSGDFRQGFDPARHSRRRVLRRDGGDRRRAPLGLDRRSHRFHRRQDAAWRVPRDCASTPRSLRPRPRAAGLAGAHARQPSPTEFSTLDVRGRIHAELLRLARPERGGADRVISPPPTHAELAARVSCQREAVTRGTRRARALRADRTDGAGRLRCWIAHASPVESRNRRNRPAAICQPPRGRPGWRQIRVGTARYETRRSGGWRHLRPPLVP